LGEIRRTLTLWTGTQRGRGTIGGIMNRFCYVEAGLHLRVKPHRNQNAAEHGSSRFIDTLRGGDVECGLHYGGSVPNTTSAPQDLSEFRSPVRDFGTTLQSGSAHVTFEQMTQARATLKKSSKLLVIARIHSVVDARVSGQL
jgi:hypothetical protein